MSARETIRKIFPAEYRILSEVRAMLSNSAERVGLSEREIHDLVLAVDEAVTNIIEHATKNIESTLECMFHLDPVLQQVIVELHYRSDSLFAAEPAPTALDIEQRITSRKRGGLGVYLMHRLVDSLDYRHDKGDNVISLEKRHKPDQ